GERVPAEKLGELADGRAVVEVRGVEQGRRLGADRLHHGGMAVPEVVDRETGEEVEVALAVGVPQLAAPPAHERDRLARIDAELVGRASRDDFGGGHARARRRRVVFGAAPRTTSVPTPRLVSTSSKSACRTRPSITWACRTPPASAAMQHSIFGIIPAA